jgi:hypothetical protein
MPDSAPSPLTRWSCTSPSPGTRRPSRCAIVSTVRSGVLLGARPRIVMSAYVTAFSAVVPAAPAAAP